MGFFSWDCECCGHPLLSKGATESENGWMNEGVAILKNGSIIKGSYGGYGTLDDKEITWDEPECYHNACWEKARKPTDFTEESKSSNDQGWFFDDGVHNVPDPRGVKCKT